MNESICKYDQLQTFPPTDTILQRVLNPKSHAKNIMIILDPLISVPQVANRPLAEVLSFQLLVCVSFHNFSSLTFLAHWQRYDAGTITTCFIH